MVAMMKCDEDDLKLAYKLSSEKVSNKPHSLEDNEEYQKMQHNLVLELCAQAALLKKKTKKTSWMPRGEKPLIVQIKDRRERREKKVR